MAVTVYDLIPDIFPDIYLQDPGSRRRYRARRELVRAADAVMAISSSAAHDTAHRLGLPPERVTVVGAAPAPTFQPPDNRSSAAREAMARVAGLEAPYVVYTGGPEPRKNMERLIEAWSRLLEPVRSAWQLAIVCKLDPLQDNHYRTLAARAGVADRVLLTGYVPDETLRLLYQGTDLVVFPSMYEGYGLPVAEGLACGAPAIAFDPYDTAAVTAAIAAALTDDRHRGMLLEWARRPPDRWADVAHRTAAVYRSLTPRPRPSGRGRRPRVALVSPMPPAAGELVADSVRLVVAAGSAMDVDVCVDGSVEVPGAGSAGGEPVGAASRSPLLRRPETGPWVEHAAAVLRPGTLQVMDAVLPGYDVVLLRLASGPSHQIARRIARRRFVDGPVLLVEDPTDVDLPDLAPAASRILLHTDAAAAAARRRIPDRFAGLVGVWPDVYPPVTERVPSGVQPGLICCFGAVEEQRPVRLVEAFSILALDRPQLHLALVGPVGADVRTRTEALAGRLGVGSRVELTGPVDPATTAAWYRRAELAVQRGRADRTTGAIADCLAHGIPTVILGPAPTGVDGGVEVLPADGPVAALAATIAAVVDQPDRRAGLTATAHAFVATHGTGLAVSFLADLVAERRRTDAAW
jgi:glycosyltransferase involved in cell wall biosynthesis